MKKCPVCSSVNVEIVNEDNRDYIVCKKCGFDSRFEYDEMYPEERSSQKAKGRYSPYKRGGGRRTVK